MPTPRKSGATRKDVCSTWLVQRFGIVEKFPEERGLFGQLDVEGGLGGLDRCGGVGHGTDAADAGRDGDDVSVAAASQHRLEEPRVTR